MSGRRLTRRSVSLCQKEDIPGAIDQFRVYYHDVGWLENEPYPGVREMLDTLQKNGFRLFVATSKLESMAVQVLGHFGLAPYFEADLRRAGR